MEKPKNLHVWPMDMNSGGGMLVGEGVFSVCFILLGIICIISFLSIFYWLCYYSCPIFSPLYSPLPCTLPPTYIPPDPWFVSMGCTYKFFGFSISYTILNLPLFCAYQLCFLFPVPFFPIFPHPLPTDNPPCDLHFRESVPGLVVCWVYFCFCFFRFSCW